MRFLNSICDNPLMITAPASSITIPLWQHKLRASLLHLLLSVMVAVLVALIVFGLWFPYPYREVAGGRQLFLLILFVDVVCGPILTLVLFNPRKPRSELVRDLSFVAMIQLAALAYGIYTVMQARPVLLAFEADRFRVVSVAEIDPDKLLEARADLRALSLTGPRIIGVRIPKPSDPDFMSALDTSMAGLEVTFRPAFWRLYDEQRATVLQKARPLGELRRKHPEQAAVIAKAIAETGLTEDKLGYLPLQSRRNGDWVVLVKRANADVVGFAPVDGF
jgi:hypothetical protein